MGLLRVTSAAARARPSAALNNVRSRGLPFVPVDWMFRFMPYYTRDRVRFMYNMNRVYFMTGFGLLLGYYHMPFTGDHYDHFHESYWYLYRKNQLYNSGTLAENERIKHENFYPVTKDDDE